jgi:hypothetical protein
MIEKVQLPEQKIEEHNSFEGLLEGPAKIRALSHTFLFSAGQNDAITGTTGYFPTLPIYHLWQVLLSTLYVLGRYRSTLNKFTCLGISLGDLYL